MHIRSQNIFHLFLCLLKNTWFNSEIKVVNIILGVKRSRLRLSAAEKMDIIERFENGERKSHIARDLGMNESTIRTIIKRKEELKRFEMIDNYTE